MTFKKFTGILTFGIIPALIVIILIYDAIAVSVDGNEASISSLIITSAYQMPFMVFCIGFGVGTLCGHLFWRMKGNDDTRKLGLDIKKQ